ncbi:MAG: DUF1552 domain-containing protein [Polyangiales bacterium]
MSGFAKRPFPRRLFLTGAAGVTVGLPFLETFASKGARAAGPDDPGFVVFMRQGNGCSQALPYSNPAEPEMFWPRDLGALTAASLAADSDRATSELSAYADDLLLVRGVRGALSIGGCGHARGALQALTAQPTGDAEATNNSLALGESLDNRIARELNVDGTGPLTLAAMRPYGFLDSVLSYRGPNDRRGAQTNPKVAFDNIMGLVDLDESSASSIEARRQSVNDLVRDQMQSLLGRSDLSSDDRSRLDLHFTAIRDLEIRLAECTPLDASTVAAINALDGQHQDGNRIVEVAELHIDVIALALSCGYTRAATLQIGNGNDGTRYWWEGEQFPSYHWISHRIFADGSEGDPIPDAQSKHNAVDRIHARLFGRLIDRLSQYTTETGTLLQKGVCVWMNDLSNGPPHSVNNLPYVLAGGADGFLRTGAYVDAGDVTHNKMLNTLATAVGLRKGNGDPVDDFGHESLEGGLISEMMA